MKTSDEQIAWVPAGTRIDQAGLERILFWHRNLGRPLTEKETVACIQSDGRSATLRTVQDRRVHHD